jgi:plastocyanin
VTNMTFISPIARLFAALLLGTGFAAMPQWAALAAETAVVKIDNFAFTPDNLTVKAGTAVTFQNGDDIPHTVVATDHSFRSKALDTNDSFTFTFTKAGDFTYFCGLHPHMQGKITVSP